MFRRLFAVTAVLLFTALGAPAADPDRTRDAALPLDENALRALFDVAPGVIQTDGDGEIVKACVSNEEEARRFLTAPSDKLAKKEGHKQ
jgi:hypothetical protein